MAAVPSSIRTSPNAAENEGSKEKQQASYVDGILSYGATTLRDEDTIAVTEADGKSTIFSLVPANGSRPFELHTTNATLLPHRFLEKHLLPSLPPYLQSASATYILVSTKSGTGLALEFLELLHIILGELGLPASRHTVIETTSSESVKDFTRSTLLPGAVKGQEQTVLLLSGDGGVVDIINGLAEVQHKSSGYVKPVISLFPLGTGNALFHSLHKQSNIPSIYVQSLRTLLRGSAKPLPILRASFSPGARLLIDEGQTATSLKNNSLYGAVVASYGLHSTLVADSDTVEYRKHGDKRFGLVANDLLFPRDASLPHKYKAGITLGDEVLERNEHGYILATLVSNLEKTFTISPESKPLDGKLRVVEFGGLSGVDAMEVMKAAYDNGKHVGMREVGYHMVDGLRIDFNEQGDSWKWRRCCVDGLIIAVEQSGFMEVKVVEAGEEFVDIIVD